MPKYLFALGVAALVSACGSNVKLNDVPVSDLTGAAVTAQPAASSAGAANAAGGPGAANSQGERAITPLALDDAAANKAGPVNVSKVIYFDYDSFVIKPEYQGAVQAHATFLSANRVRKVVIDGHTDESGGREYNLALGQKRSEAVRRALGLLGVSEAQMEAISYGEEKPASSGTSESALARNRRAEINYR